MSALSPTHLLVLFGVTVALFGAKRLPSIGRSIGHSLREFRGGVAGERERTVAQIEAPSGSAADVTASPTTDTI